jgi:cbb3-type cytochrome oxidase subunit 3
MKRKWFVLAIIIILIALVWLFREGMTSRILPVE